MASDNDTNAKRTRSSSERTCAGCLKKAPPAALVRVIVDPATGEVAVDLAGSAFGRGAHVHPSLACVEKAAKTGFSRIFKTKIVGDAEAIGAQIVDAADRRIEGLLAGAKRARQIATGADLTVEALREGKAALVVVARDAAAAAHLLEVERAIAQGKAIAWSVKSRLGALFARDEIGVCAVLQAGVAEAIASAYQTSRPFVGSRSEAWSSSEVR